MVLSLVQGSISKSIILKLRSAFAVHDLDGKVVKIKFVDCVCLCSGF